MNPYIFFTVFIFLTLPCLANSEEIHKRSQNDGNIPEMRDAERKFFKDYPVDRIALNGIFKTKDKRHLDSFFLDLYLKLAFDAMHWGGYGSSGTFTIPGGGPPPPQPPKPPIPAKFKISSKMGLFTGVSLDDEFYQRSVTMYIEKEEGGSFTERDIFHIERDWRNFSERFKTEVDKVPILGLELTILTATPESSLVEEDAESVLTEILALVSQFNAKQVGELAKSQFGVTTTASSQFGPNVLSVQSEILPPGLIRASITLPVSTTVSWSKSKSETPP